MFELYLITAMFIIICPVSLIAVIVSIILNQSVFRGRYWAFLFMFVVGAAVFYLGHRINDPVIPLMVFHEFAGRTLPFLGWKYTHVGIRTWILSDLRSIGACIMGTMFCMYAATRTPENLMLEDEVRRQNSRLRVESIDYIPPSNQICTGVTGAGKTVFLAKSIEEILKRDSDGFIFVIDGKGSISGHSLYEAMMKISRKNGRKLIVINGTANPDLDGYVYDFQDGIESADAMVDLEMTLVKNPMVKQSAGSEHYLTLTESYLLVLIEFLLKNDIDVTQNNLCMVLNPRDLKTVLEQLDISEKEKSEIIDFAKTNWKDVQANIEKLKRFLLKGQGKKLFAGEGERTNLRKAYKENAMVLALCDEMSTPSLCHKLVELLCMDLRNMVGNRETGALDKDRRIYAFADEFSSFSNSIPLLRQIYAKCRSSNTSLTLSTQSCADIIALGEAWWDIICDSTNRFIFFRQNSHAASEAAAKLLGTEPHITNTARSSEMLMTGEGSNTNDDVFKVKPQIIRDLKVNHGFMLDKNRKPPKITYFKNKFVE